MTGWYCSLEMIAISSVDFNSTPAVLFCEMHIKCVSDELINKNYDAVLFPLAIRNNLLIIQYSYLFWKCMNIWSNWGNDHELNV